MSKEKNLSFSIAIKFSAEKHKELMKIKLFSQENLSQLSRS